MTDMDSASVKFYRNRALYYMSDKPVPDLAPEVAVFVEDDFAPAPFTQAELPQTVGADRIKLLARARILDVFPEWKQVNMTARSVELTRARIDGALTAGEQVEEAAIQAAWDWVKSVRAYSDTMEAAYEAAEDKAGFDYLTGWPVFEE
jgi:hypothetical protein